MQTRPKQYTLLRTKAPKRKVMVCDGKTMSTRRYTMLLIPFFLLLCSCSRSQGNMFPLQKGGTASAKPPLYNMPFPSPQNQTAASGTPAPTGNTAFPGIPTPDSPSAEPEALPVQAPLTAPGHAPSPLPEFPQAGVPLMENLIFTALEPVGGTMYVWGGGWNEADTGAGPEALSIGCSRRWAEFAAAQGGDYDYHDHRYKIHDGLDCSGYIGWLLYNLFHTEASLSEGDGYVMKSTLVAKTLADYGWGKLIPASDAAEWKPGDICSMSGHVWLSLGTCQDGSVLLLHASPPGVRICGTASSESEKTDAVMLAEKWMSGCYPQWYERFPGCSVSNSYLTSSDIMRWSSGTLEDAERFQAMSAEEAAAYFMPES